LKQLTVSYKFAAQLATRPVSDSGQFNRRRPFHVKTRGRLVYLNDADTSLQRYKSSQSLAALKKLGHSWVCCDKETEGAREFDISDLTKVNTLSAQVR